MNTPSDCPTTVLDAMWDGLPKVTTRHRDLPLRIQVDPDVLVIELTGALASHGLTLRTNPESGDLWLTRAK